jgi:hypothetical protein
VQPVSVPEKRLFLPRSGRLCHDVANVFVCGNATWTDQILFNKLSYLEMFHFDVFVSLCNTVINRR